MNKRTPVRIRVDVLRLLNSGESRISRLMRQANICHEVLDEVLRELMIRGLVELDGGDFPRFAVTDKGREFLREYDHYSELLEKYGFPA